MLQLESVSKRFSSGNYGVRDLSLDVKGGVLGLLGPNGAGKTTLMQMIATVTKPSGGRISFRAPTSQSCPVRRSLKIRVQLADLGGFAIAGLAAVHLARLRRA